MKEFVLEENQSKNPGVTLLCPFPLVSINHLENERIRLNWTGNFGATLLCLFPEAQTNRIKIDRIRWKLT